MTPTIRDSIEAQMLTKKKLTSIAKAYPRKSQDLDFVDSSGKAFPECKGRKMKNEPLYPEGWKLAAILTSLCIGTLLIAIDNTIIGVALPEISTVFDALDDVGWYGSAYLLTLTALQPTFGKVYKHFDIKSIYVVSVVVFEGQSISLYRDVWY